MATLCSKPGHTEKNNSRLSEEFQETRAMKLPGNFGLNKPRYCSDIGKYNDNIMETTMTTVRATYTFVVNLNPTLASSICPHNAQAKLRGLKYFAGQPSASACCWTAIKLICCLTVLSLY